MSNDDSDRPVVPSIGGLIGPCAKMVAVLAALGGALAVWRYAESGSLGVAAAGLAAGLCLVGAIGAFLATTLVRSPQAAVSGMLLGMMFRLGLPLVVLLIMLKRGGELIDAGLVTCFLICYPVGLLTETLLVLPFVKKHAASMKKSAAAPPA